MFTPYLGNWQGTTQTWFEPNKLADTSPWAGTIRMVLGGKFLLHEYTGAIDGNPFEGMLLVGNYGEGDKLEAVWVDSFHMGGKMMNCMGAFTADGFSIYGEYDAPEGPPWGWRTEYVLTGPDELTIKAYNITPSGEEGLGVQTVYTRIAE